MSQDYSIICKTCENIGIYNIYSDDNLRKEDAIDLVKNINLIANIYELKSQLIFHTVLINY